MRHNRLGRQLSRTHSHRKAMLRNLVTSLFEHERITTTLAKAKEGRRFAERLITTARRGDLPARRRVSSYVRSETVARKLMEDIAPRFQDRPGGYTRIFRVGPRSGDGGEMAILELVERREVEKGKDKGKEAEKAGKGAKGAKGARGAKGGKKAKAATSDKGEKSDKADKADKETKAAKGGRARKKEKKSED
jgi:large subunit ribosomal protein L17